MLPSYRLFPRILRWFRRFRQRRGYGVHSPFAFEWITDVVYNQQAQYYAYAPLSQQHKQWSGVLSIKDARLLFRMANHCRAKCILMVGQGLDREKNYLQAARPSAQIVLLSDNQAVQQYLAQHTNTPPHFDFVLWMADEVPDASTFSLLSAPNHKGILSSPTTNNLPDLHPTAVWVLLSPHDAPTRTTAWKTLQQSEWCTVSFDLHRFGVAFHYPKLQRQHYVVNYF